MSRSARAHRSLLAEGAAPVLGTVRRQAGMVRIDVILVTLAVISALGVVASQHQSRKLHTALERETARMQQLEVEWGQLQLEQSTWAAHVRIEKIARQRLQMQAPTIGQILVIEEGT
jgi:cell division protein FtsL